MPTPLPQGAAAGKIFASRRLSGQAACTPRRATRSACWWCITRASARPARRSRGRWRSAGRTAARFTLYPLGHVPYGRLAVAPVTLDGQVVLSTQGAPAAGDRRSPAWFAAQLGTAFATIGDPTVKVTDWRWWAAQTPERLGPERRAAGYPPGARGTRRRGDRVPAQPPAARCPGRRPMRTRVPARGPAGPRAGRCAGPAQRGRVPARSDPRSRRVRWMLGGQSSPLASGISWPGIEDILAATGASPEEAHEIEDALLDQLAALAVMAKR
jgi:hypothetical protein